MTKVIAFRTFNGKAICGDVVIPEGTELPVIRYSGNLFVAFSDGRLITKVFSENFILHFSNNDDGAGLQRGKLAYAIAHAERKKEWADGELFRLTKEEFVYIKENYPHYVLPYTETLLFNNFFYDAPIEDLQEIADYLKISL